ncbi:40S ribosomal protein S3-3 [Symbiodinium microadriaticum]|uniref:30S ribosomal protein S3, chloroplastic n=3 Tax=Symbiodinium TaxID=2949 RepID=A0A1Q9ELZ8_SYMMI|nr:40S ribosomal protein S3-3 [Symbiodinium microadriaticum]
MAHVGDPKEDDGRASWPRYSVKEAFAMDVVYGQELSLVGVAEEWEGSGFPDDFNPPAHVKEAAFNHSVLHPIIKRIRKMHRLIHGPNVVVDKVDVKKDPDDSDNHDDGDGNDDDGHGPASARAIVPHEEDEPNEDEVITLSDEEVVKDEPLQDDEDSDAGVAPVSNEGLRTPDSGKDGAKAKEHRFGPGDVERSRALHDKLAHLKQKLIQRHAKRRATSAKGATSRATGGPEDDTQVQEEAVMDEIATSFRRANGSVDLMSDDDGDDNVTRRMQLMNKKGDPSSGSKDGAPGKDKKPKAKKAAAAKIHKKPACRKLFEDDEELAETEGENAPLGEEKGPGYWALAEDEPEDTTQDEPDSKSPSPAEPKKSKITTKRAKIPTDPAKDEDENEEMEKPKRKGKRSKIPTTSAEDEEMEKPESKGKRRSKIPTEPEDEEMEEPKPKSKRSKIPAEPAEDEEMEKPKFKGKRRSKIPTTSAEDEEMEKPKFKGKRSKIPIEPAEDEEMEKPKFKGKRRSKIPVEPAEDEEMEKSKPKGKRSKIPTEPAEDEEMEKSKAKRPKGKVTEPEDSPTAVRKTFAGRLKPKTEGVSQDKWFALRGAFESILRTALTSPSKHEVVRMAWRARLLNEVLVAAVVLLHFATNVATFQEVALEATHTSACQGLFQGAAWGDLWHDAAMPEVIAYLLGNRGPSDVVIAWGPIRNKNVLKAKQEVQEKEETDDEDLGNQIEALQQELQALKRKQSRSSLPKHEANSDLEALVRKLQPLPNKKPGEAAKRLRLRRLCERKPSGKLNVPVSIHEQYMKGGSERDELQEALEDAGWKKDVFVKKITRKHERKDRYNKKIEKYLVYYEEGESDYEHDEEREEHVSEDEAPGKLSLARLDAAVCVDAEDDDDDEEGSEEAKAGASELMQKPAPSADQEKTPLALKEDEVKADRELQDLARDFDAAAIPWAQLSSYGVLNRIMPRRQLKPTSGKILAYAKLQVLLLTGVSQKQKDVEQVQLRLLVSSLCNATCKSVVETAVAAVKDNVAATRALRELAEVRLNDAEAGVHRVFSKYHLTVPIQPEHLNVGEKELAKLPFIPFSRWVTYLMDEGLAANHLCGLEESEMPRVLEEFWRRYEAVHPEHSMFGSDHECDYSRAVPVYSHFDEGRTYKKQGIMILSVHGALGRGTRNFNKMMGTTRLDVSEHPMRLNYIGNTWGSQFLSCSLVRTAYAKNSFPLEVVFDRFAADFAMLATNGVVENSRGTEKLYVMHLGVQGAKATKIMNVVISVMYSEGFWIRAATACKLGNLLFKFLACYQDKYDNEEEVSKKRKFVADGVFNAELNELLQWALKKGEDGYAGVEVRVTPIRTEIIIRATRTREVLGEKGRRIRELTALVVQKRFGFPENSVELFAERVECVYRVLARKQVIISGKLRAQRAKAMKFRQGYLISTGEPKRHYISEAVRHVQMRQGTIGIKDQGYGNQGYDDNQGVEVAHCLQYSVLSVWCLSSSAWYEDYDVEAPLAAGESGLPPQLTRHFDREYISSPQILGLPAADLGTMSSAQVSKKRKFVADGVFNAELNEFLARTLGEDGYAGVEVRVTPIRTEIIIRATRTREVLGEKGRRIRELTALVQKRFGFPENSVELFAERVENRASCAMAQCESLRFKLIGGLAVRRACYGVLRFIMENGAKGVEVIISGKLRAQRAKAMKFRQGYLISTGEPKRHYISEAVRHVQMRQGTIGIKVKIMMSHDPEGKMGPKMQLPDNVIVHEPKEEAPPMMPAEDQGYGEGGYDNQGY